MGSHHTEILSGLWKIGAGLMGEQGAESIHAHLNRLASNYVGIVKPLDRLRYIFNEQNLESAPTLNHLCPPPAPRNTKKRKKSDE